MTMTQRFALSCPRILDELRLQVQLNTIEL